MFLFYILINNYFKNIFYILGYPIGNYGNTTCTICRTALIVSVSSISAFTSICWGCRWEVVFSRNSSVTVVNNRRSVSNIRVWTTFSSAITVWPSTRTKATPCPSCTRNNTSKRCCTSVWLTYCNCICLS